MDLACTLVVGLALLAAPGEGGVAKGPSQSSPPPSGTHGTAPVRSGPPSPPPSGTHGTAPVRGGPPSGPRPVPMGTAYTRTYVPRFGYGYGYFGYPAWGPGVGYGFAPWLTAPPSADPATAALQLRVTAGLEAVLLVINVAGVTVGLHGNLEGERWGLSLAAQNVAVKTPGGGGGFANRQQAQARVTYAFLTGPYGRLRAELGGEVLFAPGFVGMAPTLALSGSLWVGGPVALEASVLATPFPFWQLDYLAGLAVGLGPVGLRAGWRTQVLDDRGVVDGVIHREVFMGPYAGVSVVF